MAKLRRLSRQEKQLMERYSMKPVKWDIGLMLFWAAALMVSTCLIGGVCYLVLRLIF